jgi:hypothetical protein
LSIWQILLQPRRPAIIHYDHKSRTLSIHNRARWNVACACSESWRLYGRINFDFQNDYFLVSWYFLEGRDTEILPEAKKFFAAEKLLIGVPEDFYPNFDEYPLTKSAKRIQYVDHRFSFKNCDQEYYLPGEITLKRALLQNGVYFHILDKPELDRLGKIITEHLSRQDFYHVFCCPGKHIGWYFIFWWAYMHIFIHETNEHMEGHMTERGDLPPNPAVGYIRDPNFEVSASIAVVS